MRNDEVTGPPTRSTTTLGILAGGHATRLGGVDKAWMQRGTTPQVLRWRDRFFGEVAHTLVSANRDLARYRAAGLDAVADASTQDVGPIAGLAALAAACCTPWLLTVPVDLLDVDDRLMQKLVAGRGNNGSSARDDDGAQPLVALWHVPALAAQAGDAIARGDVAVHALQRQLGMPVVCFNGMRFGNLNTPADLDAAGVHAMDARS